MPIEEFALNPAGTPSERWDAVAQAIDEHLKACQLDPRDAVVLLPFAALMAPLRAALSVRGGWQPRVETTRTLAESLGPPMASPAGLCTGDATRDRLEALVLLRGQPWAQAWAARDPSGLQRIVADLVEAAHTLRRALLARAPAQRAAWLADAAQHLPPSQGPAGVEAALLQLALAWVGLGVSASTDRLFDWRPSAWIEVRIGGPDALAAGITAVAEVPVLRLELDPPVERPFEGVATTAQVRRWRCADFEAESQAAAAAALDALNEGRVPVALVAVDREVLRRVRALLARQNVPVVDETGWLLATTPAAAVLTGLLRAMQVHATDDELLAALKAWPGVAPRAVDALEALLRGRRLSPVEHERAAALQAEVAVWRQRWQQPPRRSLAVWLDALAAEVDAARLADQWADDPAGSQVLAALGGPSRAAWLPAADEVELDLSAFARWVEGVLEDQPFLPLPEQGAEVFLMPLARAFGRPFAEVIVPGADHRHLGSSEPAPALIGEALAESLGLPTRTSRRNAQRLALAQLLHAPQVTLLRRHRDGDEALADSPDVEWLLLARARAGLSPWPLVDVEGRQSALLRNPVLPPQPAAPQHLPARLSASRLEALRACPYRFYAQAVLGLDEAAELDEGLDKRDYGNWLHWVLHRFHAENAAGPPADGEVARQRLLAAADAALAELALPEAELLPYRAAFEALVPRYLAWQAAREAAGWQWQAGEWALSVPVPGLDGLALQGRIDRADRGPGGAVELLDYKTGSDTGLKNKVKEPLEDTQLAFYAALHDAHRLATAPAEALPLLSAAYVGLDSPQAPTLHVHPAVAETGAALLQGLRYEWRQLRRGAPMPALGDGAVCDYCEARGLCRRDHWAPQSGAVTGVGA